MVSCFGSFRLVVIYNGILMMYMVLYVYINIEVINSSRIFLLVNRLFCVIVGVFIIGLVCCIDGKINYIISVFSIKIFVVMLNIRVKL